MTVLLAIDAGNTRIKWGIRRGDAWAQRDSLPTAEAARLADRLEASPRPQRAIATNVAGAQVESQLENACRRLGVPLLMVRSERERLGVTNGYGEPSQLGADRWAALIAAHHLRAGHKLVVNAGTALTIDALAGDGRFLGGLIAPGPALMRRSLDRGTAGLRLTEGAFHDFPRSTPDAITSGAIQAGVGAIVRMRDAMASQALAPGIVVLSGGAAPELAPHLPLEFAIHENLVLDGLALLARAG